MQRPNGFFFNTLHAYALIDTLYLLGIQWSNNISTLMLWLEVDSMKNTYERDVFYQLIKKRNHTPS